MIARMVDMMNSRRMNGRTDYSKYLRDRLENYESNGED